MNCEYTIQESKESDQAPTTGESNAVCRTDPVICLCRWARAQGPVLIKDNQSIKGERVISVTPEA